MKKAISRIITIISIIWILWVVISYGEILCKNIAPNPVYSSWNFFQLLVENGR